MIEMQCQYDAINELKQVASESKHNILIEGPSGCGKTYLAKLYANMLGIVDFQMIQPTVSDIRSTIEECYKLNNPIVLNIENLDLGVNAASYALLKFLEEPSPNVYIVVTVRNINRVPDTIISRSISITVSPPSSKDITNYAHMKDVVGWSKLDGNVVYHSVTTFNDVDSVLSMKPDQIEYFNNLANIVNFNQPVSDMMWTLGHYSDNSEAPVDLVIKCILHICKNSKVIQRAGIECITSLSSTRIAKHAVLAKFLFNCKYLV